MWGHGSGINCVPATCRSTGDCKAVIALTSLFQFNMGRVA